jgi:hypothetical protein
MPKFLISLSTGKLPSCLRNKKKIFFIFVPVFGLGSVFWAESIVLYYGSVQMGGVYVRYCEKMNSRRNCICHPFSFFLQLKDRPPQLYFTYLTPWSRVILEKLNGSQVVKKSPPPHFVEPGGSLPHLQVPAACPYHEPHQYRPCPHPIF